MMISLLYLLFIPWFILFWRWCIDKLGVFHANQTSMCLDPHLNSGWGWFCESGLSPPVKYFYWPFQGGTSVVDHCVFCVLCFSCFCICSLLPCGGHLLGKCWPLGSCWWCFLYFCYFPIWCPGSGVVLGCMVSWSLPFFLLSSKRGGGGGVIADVVRHVILKLLA